MREQGKPPIRLLRAQTLGRARRLRRDQTDAERRLWQLLHGRRFAGAKFRRPIIPSDFCCLGSRLVIELDGEQHADAAQAAQDERGTAVPEIPGFYSDAVLERPDIEGTGAGS